MNDLTTLAAERRSLHARVASASRFGHDNVDDLSRQLRALCALEYLTERVADLPLTDAERAQMARIIATAPEQAIA